MGATILSALIGLWVMASPAFLSMNQQAANNNYITGPLAVTFAIVAIWEVNRNAIRANLLVGTWLLVSLFFLPYNGLPVLLSNGLAALALLALALKKRMPVQNYGGGWQSLFQHNPPHLQAAEKDSLSPKT